MVEQLVVVVGLVARLEALDGRLAKITRNLSPRLRTCRLDIARHLARQGRIVDGLGKGWIKPPKGKLTSYYNDQGLKYGESNN